MQVGLRWFPRCRHNRRGRRWSRGRLRREWFVVFYETDTPLHLRASVEQVQLLSHLRPKVIRVGLLSTTPAQIQICFPRGGTIPSSRWSTSIRGSRFLNFPRVARCLLEMQTYPRDKSQHQDASSKDLPFRGYPGRWMVLLILVSRKNVASVSPRDTGLLFTKQRGYRGGGESRDHGHARARTLSLHMYGHNTALVIRWARNVLQRATSCVDPKRASGTPLER